MERRPNSSVETFLGTSNSNFFPPHHPNASSSSFRSVALFVHFCLLKEGNRQICALLDYSFNAPSCGTRCLRNSGSKFSSNCLRLFPMANHWIKSFWFVKCEFPCLADNWFVRRRALGSFSCKNQSILPAPLLLLCLLAHKVHASGSNIAKFNYGSWMTLINWVFFNTNIIDHSFLWSTRLCHHNQWIAIDVLSVTQISPVELDPLWPLFQSLVANKPQIGSHSGLHTKCPLAFCGFGAAACTRSTHMPALRTNSSASAFLEFTTVRLFHFLGIFLKMKSFDTSTSNWLISATRS